MSLGEDIIELKQKSINKIPAEALKIMVSAAESLAKSGIADKAKKTGDAAPSFSLVNMNGETVSSHNLLQKGPLVINFYRGAWCPYCNLELKALQDVYDKIKETGASLVAISPNLPDKSREKYGDNPFSFDILSDKGNEVARNYGLVFRLADELVSLYEKFGIDLPGYDGNDNYEIPIPATYIVNPDGVITRSFVDVDYTKRMDPEDIINNES